MKALDYKRIGFKVLLYLVMGWFMWIPVDFALVLLKPEAQACQTVKAHPGFLISAPGWYLACAFKD